MQSPRRLMAVAAFAAAVTLLLSGCADTTAVSPDASDDTVSREGTEEFGTGDITEFCPEEPTKVAYAKGSNNTWTRITLAEIEDEAAKCDTITEVIFADAQNDQQKAVSDINSLVAQGVGAIVVQPEFGAAQIPSIAAANAAGVGTVPLVSDPGGDVPGDYPDFVFNDYDYVGQVQADWLNKVVGKGKVAFLGGIPGAASSISFMDGLKKGLEKYPDLELISDTPIDTNWDAGQKKRVVAGLLAQHGRIDAIVSDYTLTDTGVIDAYKEAGVELPALVGNASGNINGCQWVEENFPFLTLDGTTGLGRIALRKALAASQGKESDEPSVARIPVFIDTEAGKNPVCEPDLPADADLSSALTVDQLKELLG
ncbi:substrate-binding domain-containing protein [Microbacterium sp. RD1]|uniref:substrate-binding domain-containing protein n=1 Tax=Microbacterium sp. RD1 TaxID=3457313 RepID=UPI003FA533A8